MFCERVFIQGLQGGLQRSDVLYLTSRLFILAGPSSKRFSRSLKRSKTLQSCVCVQSLPVTARWNMETEPTVH